MRSSKADPNGWTFFKVTGRSVFSLEWSEGEKSYLEGKVEKHRGTVLE
jgi:hypothetical protein